MDIIYNIQQIGNNRILLNDDIDGSVLLTTTPFFTLQLRNPWTDELKMAQIVPVGQNENWILNIQGVSQPYGDLAAGLIYFDDLVVK